MMKGEKILEIRHLSKMFGKPEQPQQPKLPEPPKEG